MVREELALDDPERLLEQARRGAPDAFSRLVRHYQSRVRGYLARFIRDADVVEDLAQDTFVRAYRGIGEFRGDSTLGVWLLGIARNLALMRLRDEARRRTHETEILRSALTRWLRERAEGAPGEPAEHEQALAALDRCLQSLPEHSASLIRDYYFHGRAAADLARASGKKESALWMTLLRIREILRRCIKGRLDGTEAHA